MPISFNSQTVHVHCKGALLQAFFSRRLGFAVLVLALSVTVAAAVHSDAADMPDAIPPLALGSWQNVTPEFRALQRLQGVPGLLDAQGIGSPGIATLDSIFLSGPWLSPGSDTLETIGFTFYIQAPWQALVLATLPGQSTPIDTVLNRSTTGTGPRPISGFWDGTVSNGTFVADGTYDFLFMEIDTLQNIQQNRRQFTVDTKAPVISAVSIVPSVFSPTAPGSAQDIEVRFSISESQQAFDAIGIDLVSDKGFLALPLVSEFAGNGDYVARCTACADSLEDGITGVEIWSLDPAQNNNVVVDSIDVNLLGPEVTLSHPTTGNIYDSQQPDSLVGMAVDRQAVAQVSLLVSGALDTTLSLSTTLSPDSTQANFSVDVSQLLAAEGVYEMLFATLDEDGVADSTRTLTYNVDRTAPARSTL